MSAAQGMLMAPNALAAASIMRATGTCTRRAIARTGEHNGRGGIFMEQAFYLVRRRKGSVKCHAMSRIIISLVIVFKGVFLHAADVTLNCDHLVAVAQSTIALRDQGLTLSSVLAEVERGELQQKLDAKEIVLLRQIVRISFTSEYTPREILDACKAGSLGIPKPKP
jgi:hypothetical protein